MAAFNYAAASVYAAALLLALALRGDKVTAVTAVIALALAFASAYAGSIAHTDTASSAVRAWATVVGITTLVLAIFFGLWTVLRFAFFGG